MRNSRKLLSIKDLATSRIFKTPKSLSVKDLRVINKNPPQVHKETFPVCDLQRVLKELNTTLTP